MDTGSSDFDPNDGRWLSLVASILSSNGFVNRECSGLNTVRDNIILQLTAKCFQGYSMTKFLEFFTAKVVFLGCLTAHVSVCNYCHELKIKHNYYTYPTCLCKLVLKIKELTKNNSLRPVPRIENLQTSCHITLGHAHLKKTELYTHTSNAIIITFCKAIFL